MKEKSEDKDQGQMFLVLHCQGNQTEQYVHRGH